MTTAGGHGAIAMAAYAPHEDLFARQLRSIQQQSLREFVCLISVDGELDPVAEKVKEVTRQDSRFVVSGDGLRRGFYLNFERALTAVPVEAQWVALADQDDWWYPDKLARLVPILQTHALVSGQSRIVRDTGEVVTPRTSRRWVPFDDLIIQNQVSGAQAVFRRGVLDLALPFPRVRTVTELHDHWIAVCATTQGTWCVVDEALQDYVQHGTNVVGEVAGGGWGIAAAGRRIRQLADQYEGDHSLVAMNRACNRLSFGWRREMLSQLRERLGPDVEEVNMAWSAFAPDHGNLAMTRFLWARLRSGNVGRDTLATFLPGVPTELFRRRR